MFIPGCGESGKSTISKQMRIIHENGFSDRYGSYLRSLPTRPDEGRGGGRDGWDPFPSDLARAEGGNRRDGSVGGIGKSHRGNLYPCSPIVNRITHTIENITFFRTSLVVGKKWDKYKN